MSTQDTTLEDTLDAMAKDAKGDTTSLGTILDDLERRGFGPFIAMLSAFVILPTGAIPGVPALIGLALILFAGQILFGRKKPWFPQRLRDIEISSEKIDSAVEKARPWAQKVSRMLRARLEWLATGPVATTLIAAATCVTAALLIPLGFIPLLPFVFGMNLLFFGLGLMARDGLVVGFGYLTFAAGLFTAITQSGSFF